MFLFLSNNVFRKAGPLGARAFSSGSGAFVQRTRVSSNSDTKNNRHGSEMASFLFEDARNSRDKCYSTTTSLNTGVAEQDLDSALDDLLQGTFDDIEETDNEQSKDDLESILNQPAEIVSTI